MSIIGWLLLGLIAGWLAGKIVNNSGQGAVLNIVLGVVGAIVGGSIFSALGGAPVTGFNLYSMLVAVVGAVVVLLLAHMVSGRRRSG